MDYDLIVVKTLERDYKNYYYIIRGNLKMKRMSKMKTSLREIIPAVALLVGMSTASQACAWWFHQPKVPEQMKKKIK